MTSTSMARIQDRARMSCPGALDGTIRFEMYDCLKEFLQRTDSWLMEIPVYIDNTTNDYLIDTGQNAVVNRLMSLGRPFNANKPWTPSYAPGCPQQFLSASDQFNTVQESQNPRYRTPRSGFLLTAGVKNPILRISDNPQASEIWVAMLALSICDPMDAEGFAEPPEWLIDKYSGCLSSGLLSRLMMQAGKPYSSQTGAQFHGRNFNQGVGTARTEVRRTFTYGSQRWAYPRGWQTSRSNIHTG